MVDVGSLEAALAGSRLASLDKNLIQNVSKTVFGFKTFTTPNIIHYYYYNNNKSSHIYSSTCANQHHG